MALDKVNDTTDGDEPISPENKYSELKDEVNSEDGYLSASSLDETDGVKVCKLITLNDGAGQV